MTSFLFLTMGHHFYAVPRTIRTIIPDDARCQRKPNPNKDAPSMLPNDVQALLFYTDQVEYDVTGLLKWSDIWEPSCEKGEDGRPKSMIFEDELTETSPREFVLIDDDAGVAHALDPEMTDDEAFEAWGGYVSVDTIVGFIRCVTGQKDVFFLSEYVHNCTNGAKDV